MDMSPSLYGDQRWGSYCVVPSRKG